MTHVLSQPTCISHLFLFSEAPGLVAMNPPCPLSTALFSKEDLDRLLPYLKIIGDFILAIGLSLKDNFPLYGLGLYVWVIYISLSEISISEHPQSLLYFWYSNHIRLFKVPKIFQHFHSLLPAIVGFSLLGISSYTFIYSYIFTYTISSYPHILSALGDILCSFKTQYKTTLFTTPS